MTLTRNNDVWCDQRRSRRRERNGTPVKRRNGCQLVRTVNERSWYENGNGRGKADDVTNGNGHHQQRIGRHRQRNGHLLRKNGLQSRSRRLQGGINPRGNGVSLQTRDVALLTERKANGPWDERSGRSLRNGTAGRNGADHHLQNGSGDRPRRGDVPVHLNDGWWTTTLIRRRMWRLNRLKCRWHAPVLWHLRHVPLWNGTMSLQRDRHVRSGWAFLFIQHEG